MVAPHRLGAYKLRVQPLKTKVVFGTGDEEGRGLMNSVQSCKVDVATIEDVDRAGFDGQLIQYPDVVDFARSDDDHAGDVAAQVEQGMQFYRGLALAEVCPRKKSQTQVDGGGVQCIDAVIQLDTEWFLSIEPSGLADQYLRKVGINAPISNLIGVRQRIARYLAANAQMLKLGLSGSQAGLNIAQTLSVGELREGHA